MHVAEGTTTGTEDEQGLLIAAEMAPPGVNPRGGTGWGAWLLPCSTAGRGDGAASSLPEREVTLRGRSMQPAPKLPFGCPGDERDSGPSR